ncbi:MAG TPA: bifunctional UDP-sugar hydrolase/5'-nucleotidase [Bacteroidales bacterium]|nr:bifunctional UDP-sugar hydrolase/5'-nucleotidase [Bacteroidales bacterium]
MKESLLIAILVTAGFSAYSQTTKRIVILHTNDLHSRVTGFGPESNYSPLTVNDDNTTGGFARIASIIGNERNHNTGTTMVLDAGDFLMGTLFQHLEPATGFQLPLMKKMGFDVVCIGNHEFDFGPKKLADIVSSSSKRGELPAILLSNAVFSKKDADDDSLEGLFNSEIIKRRYVIEHDGIKFGLFSLMGKVADENAAFAPPVTFSRQISAAKKMVKELQKEKCDIIICLSHSGIDPDENGGWKGEDVELARKVKGINLIISGHTHTRLDKPLIVNGVPIVQTGAYGRYVGQVELVLTDGKIKLVESHLISVDDRISGDRDVNSIIEEQKKSINETILNPLGMEYGKIIAETDYLLDCDEQGDVENSNLGPFVVDAVHRYVNKHSESGTDISMVATGVIREKILPGMQMAPDIFRVMSMGSGNDNVPGYPLARLYVTGKELKSILEILNVAWKSTPANYCYFSGLRVETDPEGGLLKKIRKVEINLPDGSVKNVDFSKKNKTLYSVTANSYMLQFIGIIKKMSFGLINVSPKDIDGEKITDMKNAVIDMDITRPGIQEGKEWLALIEYLQSMKDLNNNGIQDIDPKYRNAIKTHFPVSSR